MDWLYKYLRTHSLIAEPLFHTVLICQNEGQGCIFICCSYLQHVSSMHNKLQVTALHPLNIFMAFFFCILLSNQPLSCFSFIPFHSRTLTIPSYLSTCFGLFHTGETRIIVIFPARCWKLVLKHAQQPTEEEYYRSCMCTLCFVILIVLNLDII